MSLHRILVVGTGASHERFVRGFQATDRAIVSSMQADAELAPTASMRASFDAVVLAVPTSLRTTLAQSFCELGWPMLLESPLSMPLAEATRFQQVAKQRGTRVALADQTLALPAIAFLREQLQKQTFGRPRSLRVDSGRFVTGAQAPLSDARLNDARLSDDLVSLIAVCGALVGPLTRLCVDATDLTEAANVMARHGDVLASYSLNHFQLAHETTITVNCDRGLVRYEWHRNTVSWMNEVQGSWMERFFGAFDREGLVRSQAAAFLNLLEGQPAPTLWTLDDAIQSVNVMNAVQESAQARCWRELS